MISIGLILYHLLLCSCCAHVVRSMNTIGAGRKHHWCSWLIVLLLFVVKGAMHCWKRSIKLNINDKVGNCTINKKYDFIIAYRQMRD